MPNRKLRRRTLRRLLALTSALLLLVSIIAALYFEQIESQWLAFFGGILVAVYSMVAGRAARFDVLMRRRTRELERTRDRLQEEELRGDNAAEAMHAARARLKLVNDALPVPVMYFDVDRRCRYHNPACEQWLGLEPDRIEGQFLADIVSPALYTEISPYVTQALNGEKVEYEVIWQGRDDEPAPIKISQFPWAPTGTTVVGFYLLATSFVMPPTRALKRGEESAQEPPPPTTMSGQDRALYLSSITEEIMGDVDDPRTKLRMAMEQDEFLLYAQRILPVASGAAGPCYEILLRLKEEEDNLLPPGGFIPIAERYGMLAALDLWVVRRVIRWCSEQQRNASGWRPPLLCVNLAEESVVKPEYALAVRDELAQTGFPGSALCFEVAEHEALYRHVEFENLIATLKPMGCRFTIDAFGSSRVSFSHLRGLAVDFLKIDGNIIHNILRSPAELAKARAINRVCNSINVKTIAECVESDETLALVREIGVDYVQGFGIATPAPIAMLAAGVAQPAPASRTTGQAPPLRAP